MDKTLKQLSKKRKVPFGFVVDSGKFGEEQYKNIVDQHCSLYVFENALKWTFMEKEKGKINWNSVREGFEYARENKIKIKVHTLFWWKNVPEWLKNYNAVQLEAEMKRRIRYMLDYLDDFSDIIYGIDVVNEAVDDRNGNLRNCFFFQKLGANWVEKAFRWTREIMGTRFKLIYNDYGMETSDIKQRGVLNLVRGLKSKSLVDEVGFQFHIVYDKNLGPNRVFNVLNQYSALGVDVNISELDIRMKNGKYLDSTALNRQGVMAWVVISSALKVKRMKSICCWGITDKFTWFSEDAPLPFNTRYEPKPFFEKIKKCYA